jgi:hypothetical protein
VWKFVLYHFKITPWSERLRSVVSVRKERLKYVEIVRRAAVDEADDSVIESPEIRAILTNDEYSDVLSEVRMAWMNDIPAFVDHLRSSWDSEYAPDDYFDRFKTAAKNFTNALSTQIDVAAVTRNVDATVRSAIVEMQLSYEEPSSTAAPPQQSEAKQGSLEELFRDVSD